MILKFKTNATGYKKKIARQSFKQNRETFAALSEGVDYLIVGHLGSYMIKARKINHVKYIYFVFYSV